MLKRLIVFLFVLSMLGGAIMAQDEYTCDGGEADIILAAEAALEAGDLELAAQLATEAETLCTSNPLRYTQAMRVKGEVEMAVQRAEIQAFVAGAEPGLVAVGDYALFLMCQGQGTPTVIFEHGFGDTLVSWEDVPAAIATETRVCLYDRLGVGFSDNAPTASRRTTADQVADLALLLQAAAVEGPYVLVGHSQGGMNAALFAHTYPDDVVGVVLVDAYHPDFLFDYFTEPIVLGGERLDRYTSALELAAIAEDGLGDVPLAVLTQNPSPTDVEYPAATWLPSQQQYATWSTNSRYIVVEDSGHYIQRDQPQAIIEAVQWVLNAATDRPAASTR